MGPAEDQERGRNHRFSGDPYLIAQEEAEPWPALQMKLGRLACCPEKVTSWCADKVRGRVGWGGSG